MAMRGQTDLLSNYHYKYNKRGFQIELSNKKRFSRDSADELNINLTRDLIASAKSSKSNAHWELGVDYFVAQLLHYGLRPLGEKKADRRHILDLLRAGKLKVPDTIAKAERCMEKDWNERIRQAEAAFLEAQRVPLTNITATEANGASIPRGSAGKRKAAVEDLQRETAKRLKTQDTAVEAHLGQEVTAQGQAPSRSDHDRAWSPEEDFYDDDDPDDSDDDDDKSDDERLYCPDHNDYHGAESEYCRECGEWWCHGHGCQCEGSCPECGVTSEFEWCYECHTHHCTHWCCIHKKVHDRGNCEVCGEMHLLCPREWPCCGEGSQDESNGSSASDVETFPRGAFEIASSSQDSTDSQDSCRYAIFKAGQAAKGDPGRESATESSPGADADEPLSEDSESSDDASTP